MGSAQVIDLRICSYFLFRLTKCRGTLRWTGIPCLGRSSRGQECFRVFIEALADWLSYSLSIL